MYHLLRKQIVLLLLSFTGIVHYSYAQSPLYRLHREDQTYYFGITLGYNSSYLQSSKSNNFLLNDSILLAEPGSSGGISMGLVATARLSDHFQVRANPQLIIGGAKTIAFTLGSTRLGEASNQLQSLPSDRIGNFRTYLLGGVKFDLDLSSNSSARNAEDLIKLRRGDFGIEAGLGFNFYLPFVTVSPEIKISYGIRNLHQVDDALKYSNILDKIQSRMIVFSIHLED
jgi:hypothetical protein